MLRRLLLCIGLLFVLAACDPPKPVFKSTDITGVEWGRDFFLTDHNGQTRTLADFKGKAVVMFFGFTHCPDVCPTALSDQARAMKDLGALADRVQVLFVTVDPERDTATLLKQYVPAFDTRFLGLTGKPEDIARVAKDFKVVYEKKTTGSKPDEYSIDHTAGTYVFDTQGRLRLFVAHGQGPELLVHDLKLLLGN